MRVIFVYFLCMVVICIRYYSYVAVTNSIVKLLDMQNSLWNSFYIYRTSFIRSKSLHNCFFTLFPEILMNKSILFFFFSVRKQCFHRCWKSNLYGCCSRVDFNPPFFLSLSLVFVLVFFFLVFFLFAFSPSVRNTQC